MEIKRDDLIPEKDFESIWGAHAKIDGELFSYHELKPFSERSIWTVFEDGSIDDDGYSDNNWYAMPGIVSPHALGYVVTQKPWTETTPDAIWSLDSDDYAREERRTFFLEQEPSHDGQT